MRILMLAQFYPPMIGGEERHVRNLSVELARRGHEVHVGTLRLSDQVGPPVRDPGVTVHQLDNLGRKLPRLYADGERPMALPLPDPVLTAELNRLVIEVAPDVVHAHNWIVNSYLPIKHHNRVPLVYSLHDYSHVCATKRLMRDGHPCEGPSPRRCLPCATDHYSPAIGTAIYASVQAGRPVRDRLVDRFTPVSRFVAKANGFSSGVEWSGANWEVVPNFVPDELPARRDVARDPSLPADPYFFFAGDLSAQKGLLTVLAAYAQLPEPRPALLAVGRMTDDVPSVLPAGARIETEWDHERVVSGFAHSLAATLPSEWPDPCPTTILEAMSLGAPLITTAEGGIADMVVANESAIVVPTGDVPALTAAMARVADDASLRQELAARGRQRVQGFLCGSVATRFEAIYNSVAGDSASVAAVSVLAGR